MGFPRQALIEELSSRIQQAYRLRHPDWRGGCSTERVWSAAAGRLWAAHAADPVRVPLDAELFVASQPIAVPFADPWSELAQPGSTRRYRSTLRRIVRRLRGELKREIARAERLIKRGRDVREVLAAGRRISPLGCFIIAIRAGDRELANSFSARRQRPSTARARSAARRATRSWREIIILSRHLLPRTSLREI